MNTKEKCQAYIPSREQNCENSAIHKVNTGLGDGFLCGKHFRESITSTTKETWEEEFDKEYDGCCLGATQGTSDANKKDLKSFFRQSLLRFTRSVIEEAMPKKHTHHAENNDEYEDAQDISWNACRKELKENVEKILQDNK